MNNANTNPDDFDRLLADHLRHQAASEDASGLLQRIQRTMAHETPVTTPTKPRYRWVKTSLFWLSSTAVAACIMIAFMATPTEPLRASPQALLEEAQKIHQLPLDRCYLVEFQREAEFTDEANPLAAVSRTTKLWTRGDRFCIESLNPRGLQARWGRDQDGVIWISPGPHAAVRIDPKENPPRWMTAMCDTCEMRPEHLLDELLRNFNLSREESPDNAVQIIRAELKPGHWHAVRRAELELDTETKVLRTVVLYRSMGSINTITRYTLIDTQTLDEDYYRIEGQLSAPYRIFTADGPFEPRRRIMMQMFGPRGADWLKPLPKEGKK